MSKTFRWSCGIGMMALLALGPVANAQDDGEPLLTLDQEYVRLAEAVPGFGGLYVDERGTVHVYLKDLSRTREVQSLGERVEVHQGEYDFRDLFAWKAEVRGLLDRREALSLDIDERRNRIVFGVEREALDAFTAELPELLRGTRVPHEAVLVEAEEPVVTQEKLDDWINPVPAGTQIQSDGGSICTLGFNAVRPTGGGAVRGFVTNSHCTNERDGVEGTLFYRKAIGPFNLIGTEIADPPFFNFFTDFDCPPGRECRYSDAAFVDYTSDGMSGGGEIANPVFCGPPGFAGPIEVSPAQPRLPVTSSAFASPVNGMILTKVGRTTGCTFGAQKKTCEDVKVYEQLPFLPGYSVDTGITMLCQNRVSAVSGSGDSGSPVFLSQDGEAAVAGILWGGNGSSFVYSPLLFIHTELGFVVPELD